MKSGLLALTFFIYVTGGIALASPKRVISLSPAITEIIYELGEQDKLVVVSDYSDFPEAAKSKMRVGAYSHPDLEKIFLLKPDLVLVPNEGSKEILQRFEVLKVPYKVVEMTTLNSIIKAENRIATWLGVPEKGLRIQKYWSEKLKVAFKNSNKSAVRVLVEIQHEPLMVAGAQTFLDEIVRGCGGQNIFSDTVGYPRVSLEAVSNLKPQIILIADYLEKTESKEKILKSWQEFLPTKNSAVHVLDPNITTRPGPRLMSGIENICEIIKNFKHEKF